MVIGDSDHGELGFPEAIVGMRFLPTDDELIRHYLKPLVNGDMDIQGREQLIFNCDMYGSEEPWEIWETFQAKRRHDARMNKDLFFFTKQKKLMTAKGSSSLKLSRTVGRGKGTWHGEDSGKDVICSDTDRVIGLKKRFSYYNKESHHHKQWILYEYEIKRSLVRDVKKHQQETYVVCVLRKNSGPEKKRKQQEEEEEMISRVQFEHNGGEQLIEPQALTTKRPRTGGCAILCSARVNHSSTVTTVSQGNWDNEEQQQQKEDINAFVDDLERQLQSEDDQQNAFEDNKEVLPQLAANQVAAFGDQSNHHHAKDLDPFYQAMLYCMID